MKITRKDPSEVFAALAKNPGGLTAAQVGEAIGRDGRAVTRTIKLYLDAGEIVEIGTTRNKWRERVSIYSLPENKKSKEAEKAIKLLRDRDQRVAAILGKLQELGHGLTVEEIGAQCGISPNDCTGAVRFLRHRGSLVEVGTKLDSRGRIRKVYGLPGQQPPDPKVEAPTAKTRPSLRRLGRMGQPPRARLSTGEAELPRDVRDAVAYLRRDGYAVWPEGSGWFVGDRIRDEVDMLGLAERRRERAQRGVA